MKFKVDTEDGSSYFNTLDDVPHPYRERVALLYAARDANHAASVKGVGSCFKSHEAGYIFFFNLHC